MKETKDPRRAGKSGQPTVHKDHANIVLQIGVPRVNFSRCDDDHENVQNDQNCNRYCKGVQNHLWLRYVAGVRGVSVVIVMEPKRTYQHIHRNHRKRDQETVEGVPEKALPEVLTIFFGELYGCKCTEDRKTGHGHPCYDR